MKKMFSLVAVLSLTLIFSVQAFAMQILVHTPQYDTQIILEVDGKDTIESVKYKISDDIFISAEEQKLFFNGEELDNEKTLDDYGIMDEMALSIIKNDDVEYDSGLAYWLNVEDHNRYLNGHGDGTFTPNSSLTRAQAAVLIYNLLIEKEVEVSTTFSDVPPGKWYSNQVGVLSTLEIIKGYKDGTFRPNQNINRAEFISLLTRLSSEDVPESEMFFDVPVEHWAYDDIAKAYGYGWVSGYPNGTFKPDGDISRAEAATIMNRALDRKADRSYIDNNLATIRTFSDVPSTHWAYYTILEAANAHGYEKNHDGTEMWIIP